MTNTKYIKGFIAGSLVGLATSFIFMPQPKNMGSRLVDGFAKGVDALRK